MIDLLLINLLMSPIDLQVGSDCLGKENMRGIQEESKKKEEEERIDFFLT